MPPGLSPAAGSQPSALGVQAEQELGPAIYMWLLTALTHRMVVACR